MAELLDCGHKESPHSDITRGWGTDAEGKRHCYECCHAADLALMRETGHIMGYLSSDEHTVSNWPGLPLMRITQLHYSSAGGFAGRTKIARVRAIDADGAHWYGRGPGTGMYIRMHRAKVQPPKMHRFKLVWSPEGKTIAEVTAKDAQAAKRQTPYPYRRMRGEVYAEQV